MDWFVSREDERITEWTREDGYATIRIRETAGGSFVARLDVLTQAVEGERYEYETATDRETAESIADSWKEGLA